MHGPLGTKSWLTMMGVAGSSGNAVATFGITNLRRLLGPLDWAVGRSIRYGIPFISRAANNGTAIHLVSKWAGHSDLATTLKYLHTIESYEYLEMDRMLANEKANEKIVSLDEYRKAS